MISTPVALEHADVIGRIQRLVDRALVDPDHRARLAADPWTEAHAVGVHRGPTRAVLGLPEDADDEQISQALQAAIRTPAGFSDNLP
jgi:hypothetical protein